VDDNCTTNYGELQGVVTEEMPGPEGQQNPHTSYIDTFGYNIEAKVVLKAGFHLADNWLKGEHSLTLVKSTT